MQNSASEGIPFQGGSPYSVESDSSSSSGPPPANSYDKVFPALSQPSGIPPSHRNVNNNMRVKTNTVTEVFHINRSERKVDNSDKFGGEDCMKICFAIGQSTNTTIEFNACKDQALTFVVSGKANDVLEARSRIKTEFETPVSASVDIPKEYHGKLLGKGGDKVKDLAKATSCKITVPAMHDPSNIITIQGPKEGVEKAVHDIEVLRDEFSKQAYERIEVPKIYHPFISINEDLKNLVAKGVLKLNIPPHVVKKDEISIAGEKEYVHLAKAMVLEIYENMKSCTNVSIEVPKHQHKHIIGPKHSTIIEILQQTGVSVEIPAIDDNVDTITLRGPQAKMGAALTMVYNKASSVLVEYVSAPVWLHKRLRGKKGDNIRALIQDCPSLHIEFKDDADQIVIEGPPDDVTRVKEALEKDTAYYLATIVYDEFPVDSTYFKHIIGKGGANVNRLKKETGVDIIISEDNFSTSMLRIEGSKEGVAKVKVDLQEMIAKLENEKVKDVIIDHKYHQTLFGNKGEKIKEISEMFNNVLISRQPGNDVIKIRGSKDHVEKCAKHLMKEANLLEDEHFIRKVPVGKELHKFIVGKDGATIRKLREETSTNIALPDESDASDIITITGREENCKKAEELIKQIQFEHANVVNREISIPPEYHMSMIGQRGKQIQSMQEELGVRITFPNADSNSDKIRVRGPKENVDRTIQHLEKLRNEKASMHTETIKAKPEVHKIIIGKKGSNINKIRDKTQTRIRVPNPNDPDNETITITGREDEVLAAKKMLEDMITEFLNKVDETMQVDPKLHKHFVSRGASVVKAIIEETGTLISFPKSNSGSDRVNIRGDRESVALAKQRIEEVVRNLVTITCTIPKKYHRSIWNQRENLSLISTNYDVEIKFPDSRRPDDESYDTAIVNGDSDPDTIWITGNPDNCEKAMEALKELQPIEKEIHVPKEFHKFFIGKNSEIVKEKIDVKVLVPGQGEEVDFIVVEGSPENVKSAEELILNFVQDMELKSHCEHVEVDPKYHPLIIGKRGQVINKIRETYDVIISIPRENAEVQTIIIKGYEDKAKEAKEHILSLVDGQKCRVTEEIEIDRRAIPKIIGHKGRNVKKLQKAFGVEINIARKNENVIEISGDDASSVAEAKDEILKIVEDIMEDLPEMYAPPKLDQSAEELADPKGFVVHGAPWETTGSQQTPDTASIADFPSFGTAAQGPQLTSWGPRRFVLDPNSPISH